jgi:hypothetical protein
MAHLLLVGGRAAEVAAADWPRYAVICGKEACGDEAGLTLHDKCFLARSFFIFACVYTDPHK